MKVISISTDRKLFNEGSAVRMRSLSYASKMESLHIVVFSKKNQKLRNETLGNLYIYPTNSSGKLSYIFDALRISKHIILKNGLNKGDFVVTSQDPFETGLVGYFLKNKFGFPLQLQIHTDVFSSYFKNSFLNSFRVILAKFLIPKADSLRVVSSVIADSIKKVFSSLKFPVDVLPVFVDVNKYVTTDVAMVGPSKQLFLRTILIVSRLSKEKRIDVALRSFKKVISQLPKEDIGLYIIGAGPEEENLRNQKTRLGLDGKVEFRGWENQDLILGYYKSADVFLMTSEFEGYGMTLIEAGASGCPIITTNVGIAKTDIFKNGENCFVCPVGDVDCLSKAMIDLIEHPEKRELFKQRMQDSIKSMAVSKEEYTLRYVDLLNKLLKHA